MGPFSQRPGQTVSLISTFVLRDCFLISASKALIISLLPTARQPVPPQTAMIGLFWSLLDNISFLSASSSASELSLEVACFAEAFFTSADSVERLAEVAFLEAACFGTAFFRIFSSNPDSLAHLLSWLASYYCEVCHRLSSPALKRSGRGRW